MVSVTSRNNSDYLFLCLSNANSKEIVEMSLTPVVAAAAGKVFKAPVRTGRGVPEITDVYTKKCSCSRDKTIVFCRACGYYCHGRIRLKCEQHPRVILNLFFFYLKAGKDIANLRKEFWRSLCLLRTKRHHTNHQSLPRPKRLWASVNVNKK